MINLHERMLPTSAGVEPATSWSPVRRRIQLSHRGRPQSPVKISFWDFFVFVHFSKKTRLDISCQLYALQTVHTNCQTLDFLKKKIIKKYCKFRTLSATFWLGTLIGVKRHYHMKVHIIANTMFNVRLSRKVLVHTCTEPEQVHRGSRIPLASAIS